MTSKALNDEQLAAYRRDGYIVARGMFDPAEIGRLYDTAQGDRLIRDHAMGLPDAGGLLSKITLWNHPGDDLYGMFARSERIVDSMEAILGGEVYHYHSKLMLKEPEVGGAWEWHQDYGYWYQNGCLYPLMASCFIALDRASRANGCLQVLRGSHLLDRLDHEVIGGQLAADPEHVAVAKERLELDHVEMAPGDAAFFHCNLLHCSGQNRSPDPRWTLICCYNAARNDPYKESQHPRYTPLENVPDGAILAHSGAVSADKGFMAVEDDVSAERQSARDVAWESEPGGTP